MWEDLIQKAKDGGLDVVETYVFWNGHEPSPGNVLLLFTFSQQLLLWFTVFVISFNFLTMHVCCVLLGFSTILKGGMIW